MAGRNDRVFRGTIKTDIEFAIQIRKKNEQMEIRELRKDEEYIMICDL